MISDLPEESVEKLERVGKLLRTQRSLPARLETVVAIAKRTIPNCDAAGISMVIEGEPISCAVSDRLAVEVDLVQYGTGEGPCLSAMADSEVIRIDLVPQDERYRHFAPGAVALEINSVLSTPLQVGGRTVGALNLYSRRPEAFDAQSEEAARPLAEYAAEAIGTSPLYAYSLEMVDGLMESMESQAVISQATGVMAVTEQVRTEAALDRLRELALASGASLRAVAEWVIEEHPTGPLPVEIDEASGEDH